MSCYGNAMIHLDNWNKKITINTNFSFTEEDIKIFYRSNKNFSNSVFVWYKNSGV